MDFCVSNYLLLGKIVTFVITKPTNREHYPTIGRTHAAQNNR